MIDADYRIFRCTKKKKTYASLFIFMVLCLHAFPAAAFSETLMPVFLEIIEDEVFRGDISLTDIEIPDSVVHVGNRAFADTRIMSVVIPPSVTEIAQNVFENVSTPLLIVAKPGSYAAEFALDNNLDFTADTIRRALVIGQTDYPEGYELYGPEKDIAKFYDAFEEYEVTMMTNLKADEILAAITKTFQDAKEEDISLFYFSGHGNEEDGALVGIDMDSRLTAHELRTALDAVPGRKVVLVDACYSGALIGKSSVKEVETDQAAAFVQAFIGGGLLRSASLAAQRYFVMVSSKGEEKSWEADYGGLFTDALVKSRRYGDKNQDDVVSFEEAYSYTADRVRNTASVSGKRQSVQVYPENCCWFGIYR